MLFAVYREEKGVKRFARHFCRNVMPKLARCHREEAHAINRTRKGKACKFDMNFSRNSDESQVSSSLSRNRAEGNRKESPIRNNITLRLNNYQSRENERERIGEILKNFADFRSKTNDFSST